MKSGRSFFTKTLFVLVLLSGLAISQHVYAATYYVDSAGGNNSNSGTDTSHPWQTISKVNGTAFSAGDQILFKAGDTWREQLTVPSSGSAGDPITFGSYGSGAKPIVSGSDLATGWSAYSASGNYGDTNGAAGGTQYAGNVYYHKITVGATGSVTQILLYVGATVSSGHYHVALYTDNSNEPGSLVTNSTSIEKTTLTTNAWNTFTFVSNPSVIAGTYWMATESDHDFSRERPAAGSGGRESYETIAYGAFPATATPAATYNYALEPD